MLLTEQDVAKDLETSPSAVRRLVEQGKILAVEVNAGEKRKDYRIPSQGLEYFKKGLSVEQVKNIVTQQILAGGHGGETLQGILEAEQRGRASNELLKIQQKILADIPLTVEDKKIVDFHHAVKYELLHTQDKSDLEKIIRDLSDQYREMSTDEVITLLATVKGWAKEMGL